MKNIFTEPHLEQQLPGSKAFLKFKSRYIIIDYLIISLCLAILFGIMSFATGEKYEILIKYPIARYWIGIAMIIGICLLVFRRMQKNNVKIKYFFGNVSFSNIPWQMVIIIFFGIYTLGNGINHLVIFCSHLIDPVLTDSLLNNCSQTNNHQKKTLAVEIIFYISNLLHGLVIAPLSGEFIFRGIFLHRFSIKLGITVGILLSSALFGLAYANIYSMGIGVQFIFTALLYIKIPSLLVPILYHVMNNAIWIISNIIRMTLPMEDSTKINIEYLWQGLLNIAFALSILCYFLKWPKSLDDLPYSKNNPIS